MPPIEIRFEGLSLRKFEKVGWLRFGKSKRVEIMGIIN